MSDSNLAELDISSRRGMLLGMTLVEMMVIVLFCLLLLLGKAFVDIQREEDANPCYPTDENCPDMAQMGEEDIPPLNEVVKRAASYPPGQRGDFWQTLSSTAAADGMAELEADDLAALNRIISAAKSQEKEERDDFWRMMADIIELTDDELSRQQLQEHLDAMAEFGPDDIESLNRVMSAAKAQEPEERDDLWRMLADMVDLTEKSPDSREELGEHLAAMAEFEPADIATLNRIMNSAKEQEPEERDDLWQMLASLMDLVEDTPELTEDMEEHIDEMSELSPEDIAALSAIASAVKSHEPEQRGDILDDLVDQSENAGEDVDAREQARQEAMRNINQGNPPSCLYQRPTIAGELRGKSIPLGVVHIEDGHMTLVSKNRELPDLRPVNYIGDAVDYAEAYEILLDWPLGQRMDINGFAEHGAHYIRIGDDESSDKIKCRFMMSYYMEDYAVSISMLDEVFERYFFRQVRLSQDEFESIR